MTRTAFDLPAISDLETARKLIDGPERQFGPVVPDHRAFEAACRKNRIVEVQE